LKGIDIATNQTDTCGYTVCTLDRSLDALQGFVDAFSVRGPKVTLRKSKKKKPASTQTHHVHKRKLNATATTESSWARVCRDYLDVDHANRFVLNVTNSHLEVPQRSHPLPGSPLLLFARLWKIFESYYISPLVTERSFIVLTHPALHGHRYQ
jgi:hypothetical protein